MADELKRFTPVNLPDIPKTLDGKVRIIPNVTAPERAAGTELLAKKIASALAKFDKAFLTILYGDFNKPLKRDKNGKLKRKRGLYNILQEINKIDVCNLLFYALGQASISRLKQDGSFVREIRKFQEAAQRSVELIDNFYSYANVSSRARGFARDYTTNLYLGPSNSTSQQASATKLRENIDYIVLEFRNITGALPPQVFRTLPRLKGPLDEIAKVLLDIEGFINRYGGDIENIPIEDLQEINRKIRTVQGIVHSIANLDNLAGVSRLAGLDSSIQRLQDQIKPEKLIPYVKSAVNTLVYLMRIFQTIVKYVAIIRAIVRIILIIIKVFKVIKLVITKLPIPGFLTNHAIIHSVEDVKELLGVNIGKFEKALKNITSILDEIIAFSINMIGYFDIIADELRRFILNLQACNLLDDNDLIDRLEDNFNRAVDSRNRVADFVNNFNEAKRNNKKTYQGLVLDVIDEEVADEGRVILRRRAVATDRRGILVLQGDLTFATDKNLLIEELKLKLVEEGIVTENGGLDDIETSFGPLVDVLDLNDDILSDIGYNLDDNYLQSQDEQLIDMQIDIFKFIDGLKNGSKMRKKTRQRLKKHLDDAKRKLGSDEFKPAINPSKGNTLLDSIQRTSTQESADKALQSGLGSRQPLSEQERRRLQNIITASKVIRSPKLIEAANAAQKKLDEDDILRKELQYG